MLFLGVLGSAGSLAQTANVDWDNLDQDTLLRFTVETMIITAEYDETKLACVDLPGCQEVDRKYRERFNRDFADANDKRTEAERDEAKAVALFDMESRRRLASFRMCDLKDANACARLGVSLESALKDIINNPPSELSYKKEVRLRAELQIVTGFRCMNLCALALAYKSMMLGCKLGEGYGCYALAKSWPIVRSNNLHQTHNVGDGLTRAELLEKGCAQGYTAACQ